MHSWGTPTSPRGIKAGRVSRSALDQGSFCSRMPIFVRQAQLQKVAHSSCKRVCALQSRHCDMTKTGHGEAHGLHRVNSNVADGSPLPTQRQNADCHLLINRAIPATSGTSTVSPPASPPRRLRIALRCCMQAHSCSHTLGSKPEIPSVPRQLLPGKVVGRPCERCDLSHVATWAVHKFIKTARSSGNLLVADLFQLAGNTSKHCGAWSTAHSIMVEASTRSLKERATLLQSERAAAETRVQDIASQLDSMPGKPGLHGKLVDAEARNVQTGSTHASAFQIFALQPAWCPLSCVHAMWSSAA